MFVALLYAMAANDAAGVARLRADLESHGVVVQFLPGQWPAQE